MTANMTLAGRYDLGAEIGTGGMSDVYQATDTLLGREVAVKILRVDLARDATFRERFRREAQHAGSLNHPSIVAVYDTGETEIHGIQVPYIVMELVHGKTLRDLVKENGPMSPREAAKSLIPVCHALQASHDAGLIHRDIKPANIMITNTGQVKVMDFGIARALGDATSAMTATAAVIGTAQYLSPEQARGKAADARSDVYAVGCVMYEMITGRPPFEGESPFSIAYQHVQDDPEAPSTFINDLSPTGAVNVDAVVLTAMAKHPDDRYQSATELAEDLERLANGTVSKAARLHLADPTEAGSGARAAGAAMGGDNAQTVADLQRRESVDETTVTRAIQTPPPPEQAIEYYEAPEKSRSKAPWGTILATLAVLSLLGIGGFFAWDNGMLDLGSTSSKNMVEVPDVANLKEEEASAKLTAAGFKVLSDEQPSPTVARGNVISTNPASGSQVAKGTSVTMLVSSGKEITEVPDVKGKTTEAAAELLKKSGLELDQRVKEVNSDTAPIGEVVDQSPAPGSQVSKGSKVTISISAGVEQIRVPDITGMQWERAESNLTAAGLVPQVVMVDSNEPKGTVVSVTGAGTMLAKGSTVTVNVSNGLEIKMPKIEGMLVPQAIQALRTAGWTAPETSLQQKQVPTNALIDQGKISAQTPAPGTLLRKDEQISVDILQFQLLPVAPPAP